ncbi:MAG TPA: hypothetical protein VNT51_12885 [Miltoncostaeaceae bacterium]|nr:hypothetical protein [Miltoncostaeaceae bacterium]
MALTYLAWAWHADGGADEVGELDPVWVADHLLRLPPDEREEDAPVVAELLRAAHLQGLLGPEWDPVLADPRPAGRLLPVVRAPRPEAAAGDAVVAPAAHLREAVGA